jgi:Flp pilus assembly protein TadD
MASGDLERLAPALGTIGVLLMDSGQTVEARRVFEEVLSVTARSGDTGSRARALHNLGLLEAMEKRDTQAVACFEEAFKQAWQAQDLQTAALSERFLNLVRESPDSPSAPSPESSAPEAPRHCPGCQGSGLVMKEDYGMVLCPDCKGACQI